MRCLCFAHLIKFYILTDTAKLPSSLLFIYKARKRKFRVHIPSILFLFCSLIFKEMFSLWTWNKKHQPSPSKSIWLLALHCSIISQHSFALTPWHEGMVLGDIEDYGKSWWPHHEARSRSRLFFACITMMGHGSDGAQGGGESGLSGGRAAGPGRQSWQLGPVCHMARVARRGENKDVTPHWAQTHFTEGKCPPCHCPDSLGSCG